MIFNYPCRDFTVFSKARGPILYPQNGPKMGSESCPRRGTPRERLLERSWRLFKPKKTSRKRSWCALDPSWSQFACLLGSHSAGAASAFRNARRLSQSFTSHTSRLTSSTSRLLNTAGARRGARRIQSLTRIPPGLGPWIEGPLAKEPSARIRDQHGGNIASKWLQN